MSDTRICDTAARWIRALAVVLAVTPGLARADLFSFSGSLHIIDAMNGQTFVSVPANGYVAGSQFNGRLWSLNIAPPPAAPVPLPPPVFSVPPTVMSTPSVESVLSLMNGAGAFATTPTPNAGVALAGLMPVNGKIQIAWCPSGGATPCPTKVIADLASGPVGFGLGGSFVDPDFQTKPAVPTPSVVVASVKVRGRPWTTQSASTTVNLTPNGSCPVPGNPDPCKSPALRGGQFQLPGGTFMVTMVTAGKITTALSTLGGGVIEVDRPLLGYIFATVPEPAIGVGLLIGAASIALLGERRRRESAERQE